MLDRKRQSETERGEERRRAPTPVPAVRAGTKAWASAVGNAAVARLARQSLEAEEGEAETSELEPEPDALESEGPELEDEAELPE